MVDKTKIMLSHLQTEVGVEVEAELGNIYIMEHSLLLQFSDIILSMFL